MGGRSEQALLEAVWVRRLHRALELTARYSIAALGERRVTIGFGPSLVFELQTIGGRRVWSVRLEQEFDVLVEQAVALLLREALLAPCQKR